MVEGALDALVRADIEARFNGPPAVLCESTVWLNMPARLRPPYPRALSSGSMNSRSDQAWSKENNGQRQTSWLKGH